MKEFAKASAISVVSGQRRGGEQSGSQIVSYLFLGLHATRNLDLYIYKSNYLFPCFSGFHLTDYLTA